MNKSDYVTLFFLSFAAFISRFPLLETFQSHWDGPQYSIAVVAFSYIQATPAPPGYPLYIGLGKLINTFVNNPHFSILLISVLASIAAVIVLYLAGKLFYNKHVGAIAAMIYLTGSTFYYFGITAYPYGLLPVLMLGLAYAVYDIFINRKQRGILLGIILGIFFGIRPQEILQFGPLFLLGFFCLNNKQKLLSLIPFTIITIAWLIPVLESSDGIIEFLKVNAAAAKVAFPEYSLAQTSELMIKGFLLSFGIAAGFLSYYVYLLIKNVPFNWKIIVFYTIWILPGLYYNLFIRSDHAGYQMSYLSAFLVLIAYALWKTTNRSKILFSVSLLIATLFNLIWFFYDRDPNFEKPYRPSSFHYTDIRKNDLKLGSKIRFVKSTFDPKSTLLLSSDILWRPYMYHLKDYPLIALGGLYTNQPDFIYDRFDARYWKMKESQNTSLEVVVPEGIKTIVFLDDESARWIKDTEFTSYTLPGNSIISEIDVKPGMKLFYKKEFVQLKK